MAVWVIGTHDRDISHCCNTSVKLIIFIQMWCGGLGVGTHDWDIAHLLLAIPLSCDDWTSCSDTCVIWYWSKRNCGNGRKNYFEIISVFYFTCNLRVWNWNKIILAAEGVLKLFQNYLSDIELVWKYSWAAISPWNNFEIISGKFPYAEIDLFQTDVGKGWSTFISHITTALLPGDD